MPLSIPVINFRKLENFSEHLVKHWLADPERQTSRSKTVHWGSTGLYLEYHEGLQIAVGMTEHHGAKRSSTKHLWFAFSNRFMLSFYHSVWFILSFSDFVFLIWFFKFWVLSGLYKLFSHWFLEETFIDQTITSQSYSLIRFWRLFLKM